MSPPTDEAGTLVRLSERPLVCSASLGDRVVLGGTDHALYELQVHADKRGGARSAEASPSVSRRLYSKSHGHSEWVTDVAYLADGRIVSAAMDGKLCVWDAGRAVRCTELKGHTGSVSCIAVHSSSVRLPIEAQYDALSVPGRVTMTMMVVNAFETVCQSVRYDTESGRRS